MESVRSNPVAVRSKNRIVDALFGLMKTIPYREITIKEIAHHAKLVRRTFYGHFSSKDDVIRFFSDRLFADFMVGLRAFEKLDTFLVAKKFFELSLANKEILVLFRKNDLLIPIDQLEGYHRELKDVFFCDALESNLLAEDYEIAVAYYAGGLLNVLNKWIDEGMERTPEEMATIFDFLLKSGD